MAAEPVKGLAVAAATNPIGPLTRVSIVYTQWNPRVIDALVGGVLDELLRNGVKQDNIHMVQVRPARAAARGPGRARALTRTRSFAGPRRL